MNPKTIGGSALFAQSHTDPHMGVNPSISDSSTYSFKSAQQMSDTFIGETEGMYLYSRHSSPTNNALAASLAAMEGTQDACVFGSGMGAISAVLFQLCSAGDEVVSSQTIYGGSYALLKNFMPKFGIETRFVDFTNVEAVSQAIGPNTKVLYCETMSNPLLEITHIKAISELAEKHQLTLVVDNTFSPLIVAPATQGAHIVIHSLTKFINGTSDAIAGVVCASNEFCASLKSVMDGAAMLFGSTLDAQRAATILKNMKTLPIRMAKHSENALYIAKHLEAAGYRVSYPGLESHPGKKILEAQWVPEYGYGGLLTLDAGSSKKANALMEAMQEEGLGYLAVSLGFYKTLFSASASSTSSEISESEQKNMGLSSGLVRFSIGLDPNIVDYTNRMLRCIDQMKL